MAGRLQQQVAWISGAGSGIGAAVARLLGVLRERDQWLLIFDNAEDLGALADVVAGLRGHRDLRSGEGSDVRARRKGRSGRVGSFDPPKRCSRIPNLAQGARRKRVPDAVRPKIERA